MLSHDVSRLDRAADRADLMGLGSLMHVLFAEREYLYLLIDRTSKSQKGRYQMLDCSYTINSLGAFWVS